jgi:PleD family two-component response regulator
MACSAHASTAVTPLSDQCLGLSASGISIGVAAYDALAGTLELICKRADDALYRAKANGCNRVAAALA